ncbi:MAG: P-loop domain-containing protein, partial [Lentisphaerota bacterium]
SEGVARRHLLMAQPGQTILPRSSMVVTQEFVEARIYLDLPTRRGLIASDVARDIFFSELPEIVSRSLIYYNLPIKEVEDFVDLMEDADAIRQMLPTRGWIGFVADGALLARSPEGLDGPDYQQVQPFSATDDILTDIKVPKAGFIKGVCIPAGITLILGDDYSGRIELMQALAAGIYNHIPGDGRELAITVPDAVHVQAEPGRSVQQVDIGPFVSHPSMNADARHYSCEHANALASQAASVAEMIEAGARVLLFDESDSAPGFLARDPRLASLFAREERSIHPLSQHADRLTSELGVSVIVAGHVGVSDFIPIADTIFRIENRRMTNVTQEARLLIPSDDSRKADPTPLGSWVEKGRWIIPSSVDPSIGTTPVHIKARDRQCLEFGRTLLDLKGLSQISDRSQTQTIGYIFAYIKSRYMDQPRPIREILDLIDRDLSSEGLEVLARDLRGDLARPRRYEIAMALNRLATLRVMNAPA